MAVVMDQDQQQQAYKHYCRVCKKGFGCGRALGGHMRAHGIGDDCGGADLDDGPSSCSAWADGNPPSNKRMYALRANPNRLKGCRVCENCGKEFVSWKSFLEHGKCSSDGGDAPDDGDSCYAASPTSDADEEGQFGNWSKGKRTRRTKPVVVPASTEEEDLANCLMLLSSARVEPTTPACEPEESSCASASKAPLLLQAPGPVPKGMFECKACKKVFASHQALGGHRASHKKVKGCFAAKLDDLDEIPPEEEEITGTNDNPSASAAAMRMAMAIVPFNNAPLAVTPLNNKRSRIHECSICHRQFASGQALGGHKRCHWITSNNNSNNCSSSIGNAKPHQIIVNDENQNRRNVLTLRPAIVDLPSSERLDLNLPAEVEVGSPLRLDLQPSWVDDKNINKDITSNDNIINDDDDDDGMINESGNNNEANNNADDEADSKVKMAKLSELKDMSEGGKVNWLQVGIGSSANAYGSGLP